MRLSFPNGSQEKMRHRYASFKDPVPIRRRRIEFNTADRADGNRKSAVPPLIGTSVGRYWSSNDRASKFTA